MTSHYRCRKLPVPLRLRLRQLAGAVFLVAVIALIPLFLWLQTRGRSTARFAGLVDAESETVGPVATARVLAIEVRPGQRVAPGDVLVRLEAPERAVDLAMNEARLQDYEQGLRRYEQDAVHYRQTLQESERRSRQAVHEAAVAVEAARMARARDVAELAGLQAEIARLQPLVDRRLVSETELSTLRPKAQALEQAMAQYTPLIATLQARHEQALRDGQEVAGLLAAPAAKPVASNSVPTAVREAVATCRQAAAVDATVLRASRVGVVSRVLRQAGDVVVAGDPIVRVTASESSHITGMLTPRQVDDVAVGDTLRVTRGVAGGTVTLTAQVEAIEPEVMDLLDPFNPAPRFPLRGRRLRAQVLAGGEVLVPGEAVILESARRETWLEGMRRICFLSGIGRPRSARPTVARES